MSTAKSKKELLKELKSARKSFKRWDPHSDTTEAQQQLVRQLDLAVKACNEAKIDERDIYKVQVEADQELVIERLHRLVDTMSPERLAEVLKLDDRGVLQAIGYIVLNAANLAGVKSNNLIKQTKEFAKTRLKS